MMGMAELERVVTIKRRDGPDQPWRYWLTQPMSDRIVMVEELRREHHGWTNETEPRLQRVHRVFRRA